MRPTPKMVSIATGFRRNPQRLTRGEQAKECGMSLCRLAHLIMSDSWDDWRLCWAVKWCALNGFDFYTMKFSDVAKHIVWNTKKKRHVKALEDLARSHGKVPSKEYIESLARSLNRRSGVGTAAKS